MTSGRVGSGKLVLVPWHIGHWGDVTLRALREVRRLRVLLSEEPAPLRAQLEADYKLDCAGKEIVQIGFETDPALLERCKRWLENEDVGLISSSGTPCFIDPGAWLVRELRAAGVELTVLAGASALTAALSASGVEWFPRFTFQFFRAAQTDAFVRLLGERKAEPLVLFVAAGDLPLCRALLAEHAGRRVISVHSNLAKLVDRSGSAGAEDAVVIVEAEAG